MDRFFFFSYCTLVGTVFITNCSEVVISVLKVYSPILICYLLFAYLYPVRPNKTYD